MDYFFKYVRKALSICKITNAHVKEIFWFTTQLDLLTPELFFELCISQEYI